MINFGKKSAPLSGVLSYVAIDQGMLISDDPMRLTGIALVHLSSFDDLGVMGYRHEKLMGVFCEFVPDVTISIYYCKSFYPTNPVLIQNSKSDVVNYMEKNKYDYVTAYNSPEYAVYMAITIPVATKKKVLKKHKKEDKKASDLGVEEILEYKTAQKELKSAFNLISAVMGAPVLRLDNGQILMFLSKLVNHEYLPNVTGLSDIIQSDWVCSVAQIFDTERHGYVHYNDNYHTVLSLRANQKDSKMPSHTHPGLNMIFSHKDLYEIPFILQHSMTIPEKSVGLSRARRRANMIANREGLAKHLKMFEKTPEGLPPEVLRGIVEANIERVESSSAKFIEQFFHIHLWDKTLNGLEKKYAAFDATIKMTYKMKREKFNIKGAYFSLFPGNEDLERIRTTLLSDNVADIMPIDLPRWPYFNPDNEWQLYYYNEMDAFCKVDLFDKGCTNYNAIVAGASGSGKSFSEQDKLWQVMKYDPCVAIIDFGGEGAGSYLSFVKNLNGTYLEINLNKPVSLNPFVGRYFVWQKIDLRTNEVIEERDAVVHTAENGEKYLEKIPDGALDERVVPDGMKHYTLMSTLLRMFKGKRQDVDLPANLEAAVVYKLRDYFKTEANNVNNTCNLDDFAERYLKDAPEFRGDWDLYARITEYIGSGENQGAYANFFRGSSEFKNDDIICFDMAGLDQFKDLKAVLIPALISMIMLKILNNPAKRHRKKLIVMDEAWRDLQGGDMAKFMEEMFRTVRKLNGQVTIITQSIRDLLGSKATDALMSNTSYFWLIGGTHDPDALRQINVQSTRLTEYDIGVITSQRNKRDMYLFTPYFRGQLRFYPTAEFIMLATTNPDHRIAIDVARKEVGVDYTSPAVIEKLRGHKLFPARHHVADR